MIPQINVSHSILCGIDLAETVIPYYEIGNIIECELITSGFNDTYLLRTEIGKYIIRAYRAGWRTSSEILFELEVLFHLHNKGVSVSYPIIKKDGTYTIEVGAPEGIRTIVLFTYAEGSYPPINTGVSSIYGTVAGQMHTALKDFTSSHTKRFISLETVLCQPCEYLISALQGKEYYLTYIKKLSEIVQMRVTDLPITKLTKGICHGDLAFYNANYKNGKITIFDFDFCGPGWIAYDLGIMRWEIAREEELWTCFLESYLKENSLNETDLKAIPLLAASRQIWTIGNSIKNISLFGSAKVRDTLEESIEFLMKWTKDYLDIV